MTTNILTNVLALLIVWGILAFAIGVIIGKGIRNADRRERPTLDVPDDPRDIDGLD